MRILPTVLIVPGIRDHVADHWQTHLTVQLSHMRAVCSVPPLGRNELSLARRVHAIRSTLEWIEGPAIAIAHSGGVIALAHWAQQFSHDAVVGALLATPADLETPLPEGYPMRGALEEHGWLPLPRTPLPFPSIVAISSNDPLARPDRVAGLARAWGSDCVHLGAVGHLNPASGFGPWPQARALIEQLERRIQSASPALN
ncbi:MAG: alpha/beta hydrolase [Steroidobacteraceae bacterium]